MRVKKANSAEDHKLISSFHAVRKTLLKEEYAQRREKPLAYWALPNDRRLPLAFLGRTIGELLDTPIEQLSATQGIGQKKISTLVKLLHRVVVDEPSVPFGIRELSESGGAVAGTAAADKMESFDPAAVSESVWMKWRQTVRRHQLGSIPLGRLAPTLKQLPTVIWDKPLADYLDCSIAEIRGMRTHGEKRVRVVLEVFHIIHTALAQARVADHVAVTLAPRFALAINAWIQQTLDRAAGLDLARVRTHLTEPLLERIRVDAGEVVHDLAAGRLGFAGQPESVRLQAKRLAVTRARVYQLLDDCATVMSVRWPEGRASLKVLCEQIADKADETALRLLVATRELFFPEKARASDNGRP
jgi:hypothetical protein